MVISFRLGVVFWRTQIGCAGAMCFDRACRTTVCASVRDALPDNDVIRLESLNLDGDLTLSEGLHLKIVCGCNMHKNSALVEMKGCVKSLDVRVKNVSF